MAHYAVQCAQFGATLIKLSCEKALKGKSWTAGTLLPHSPHKVDDQQAAQWIQTSGQNIY